MYRPDLLKDLADYLMKVPKNQFDLTSWTNPQDDEEESYKYKKLEGNPTLAKFKECKSTGCALGHAVSVRSIAKAGLKLKTVEGDDWLHPMYKGSIDESAAEALFGIPNDVAEALFMPNSYTEEDMKNPKAVAKRIYNLIADPFTFVDNIGY